MERLRRLGLGGLFRGHLRGSRSLGWGSRWRLRLGGLLLGQRAGNSDEKSCQEGKRGQQGADLLRRNVRLTDPVVFGEHSLSLWPSHWLGKLLFSRLFPVITSITYGEAGAGGAATFAGAVCFGAAGAAPANRLASRIEGGPTLWVSTVLRRASWIFPSVLAMASRPASSGDTNKVITGTVWGLPSRSCSIF